VNWTELGDSLLALVSGLIAPSGDGLVVTRAELAVPLEVRLIRRDGGLVLCAQPPHSRWLAGFLPAVHVSRLTVELGPGDGR